MDKPKIVNKIMRNICAQAFGGVVRDIKFNSRSTSKTPKQFFDAAKPLLNDTLEILQREGSAYKICTRLHFGEDSSVVYAIRLDDYDLDNVIDKLLADIDEEVHEFFPPNQIYLILNVTEYDRELEKQYMLNGYSSSDDDDSFYIYVTK